MRKGEAWLPEREKQQSLSLTKRARNLAERTVKGTAKESLRSF